MKLKKTNPALILFVMDKNWKLVKLDEASLSEAAGLWNEVVAAGDSFPGDTVLSEEEAGELFRSQTETVCMFADGRIAGLYILHPNGIGRLAHIANASYAVSREFRGMGLGRVLVRDSVERARAHGFRGLQFNAVVATNTAAVSLYLKLGFRIIGTVAGGYRMKEGGYCDTLIFLKTWAE